MCFGPARDVPARCARFAAMNAPHPRLLGVLALFGTILASTALAQGTPPATPAPGGDVPAYSTVE